MRDRSHEIREARTEEELYAAVEDGAADFQFDSVAFCECTNDELEAGHTCDLPQCPNREEEEDEDVE
jgi:hypothetical protein